MNTQTFLFLSKQKEEEEEGKVGLASPPSSPSPSAPFSSASPSSPPSACPVPATNGLHLIAMFLSLQMFLQLYRAGKGDAANLASLLLFEMSQELLVVLRLPVLLELF